jgi:phosphinothricin acetyltransferase
MEELIREAVPADAPAMLEIYRPHVEDSTVSFETVMPSLAEFNARMAKVAAGWRWLVAEEGGRVLGYAYGSQHRERAAYRHSVDTSVYIHPDARRRGLGQRLYRALFVQLSALGYCQAYAGITLPNDASIGLHRSVGFEPVGVFHRAGHKFGHWRDVAWLERPLRDAPLDPGGSPP